MEPLRFLSFNLFKGEGLQETEQIPCHSHLSRIQNWIQSQNADVVALLELNVWSKEQLSILAKGWGHEYSYLMRTNIQRYQYIGVTSRYPMMEVNEFLDGFWHGLLHIKIQLPFTGKSHVHNSFLPSSSFPPPISSSSSSQMCHVLPYTTFHILVSHLNPQSSVARLQEAESII